MSSAGQLQSIKDLNGNVLTFTSSGISSTVNGIVIPFLRDSQNGNRVTEITDRNGKNYIYGYDSNGNLSTRGEKDFATGGHARFDASSLVMVTLRQSTGTSSAGTNRYKFAISETRMRGQIRRSALFAV